jgi:tetratricopeptide (TPR) repeat protein
MRDRPGNALPVLTRAEEMFTHLQGENAPSTATARAHRACALFKMGRQAQSLPLFMDAIKVLEKNRPEDGTYTLALANAAQLLAERGELELANEYVHRAQRLMPR